MNRRSSTFAGGLSLLLLSLWLGAAIFFSSVVAPTAFGALRSFQLTNVNEIAGAIVSRALAVINLSGATISLFLLALTLTAERKNMMKPVVAGSFALGLMAGSTVLGHWVIAARMHALRTAMVAIDLVSPDDPRRIAFNNLHRYSVMFLMVAMLAAIAALVFAGFRPMLRSRKTS